MEVGNCKKKMISIGHIKDDGIHFLLLSAKMTTRELANV
jgi:hypothetical protein